MRLPAALALAGVLAVAFSFLAAEEQKTLEALAATVRPAKATLRSTTIEEWIAGRGNWNAFGTFDVVAGDHRGTAKGSLKPEAHRRAHRSRYQTPRGEAEGFLSAWEVGRTYDAFWDPDHPGNVFFSRIDPAVDARMVLGLRILGGLLLAGAVFLARTARR